MKKKVVFIALAFGGFATVICLSLFFLGSSISFFYTPTEVLRAKPNSNIRVSGFIVQDSIIYQDDCVMFSISDAQNSINVIHKGVLPPIFKDNFQVVIHGKMQADNALLSSKIISKHDENYYPNYMKGNNST